MITKKAFAEGLHYSTYGTGRRAYPYIVFDWKRVDNYHEGWKYMLVLQKGTTKKQALELAYKWMCQGDTDLLNWSPVYTWKVAGDDQSRFKIPLNLPNYN
jgi:hypothetical protein